MHLAPMAPMTLAEQIGALLRLVRTAHNPTARGQASRRCGRSWCPVRPRGLLPAHPLSVAAGGGVIPTPPLHIFYGESLMKYTGRRQCGDSVV
jgi:hypothetical protein